MPKTHFPRSGGQEWVDSFYRFGEPTASSKGRSRSLSIAHPLSVTEPQAIFVLADLHGT